MNAYQKDERLLALRHWLLDHYTDGNDLMRGLMVTISIISFEAFVPSPKVPDLEAWRADCARFIEEAHHLLELHQAKRDGKIQ